MNKKFVIVVLVVALCAGGYLYKDVFLQMFGLGLTPEQNEEIEIPPLQPQAQEPKPCTTFNECVESANKFLADKKYDEAIGDLLPFCEQQNAKACEMVAKIYGEHKNDSAKNLSYNQMACDFGGMDGCYALGVKYYRGDGISRDVKQSFALFKKVCDGGKMDGCNNLAVIYNNADGVKRDIKLAKTLFKKACDSGYKPSCENLKKIK